MNAPVERLNNWHASPMRKLANWVNRRLKARRANRIEMQKMEFLRALGPQILNDIGIDIAKLDKLHPTFPVDHPKVAAALIALCAERQAAEHPEQ